MNLYEASNYFLEETNFGIKLWIDDIRPVPEGFVWVKNSKDAIDFIDKNWDDIVLISFDHDLGGDDTAYKVATWMEEEVWNGRRMNADFRIHSANPVGRRNLEAALNNIRKIQK